MCVLVIFSDRVEYSHTMCLLVIVFRQGRVQPYKWRCRERKKNNPRTPYREQIMNEQCGTVAVRNSGAEVASGISSLLSQTLHHHLRSLRGHLCVLGERML